MNKKVLGITVFLMAVAMLATPIMGTAMADPTKGQKVTASVTFIPPPSIPNMGDPWWTESGVFHGKGRTEAYSAILVIDGTPCDAFVIMVSQVGTWNPQQETMIMHSNDIVYIPSEGSSDGFSGMGAMKFYGYSWITHMWASQKVRHIWHGFGSFEGQTLMLSYEGPRGPTMTGYCLKG